ncbi:unnamed protein product [Symbiodinium natans]|uniref:Uncharacterized protein n=1 Tax=Symbiodinium natans TaxID=878477 RepID=A0A812JV54_9DINO|nr:unnamed protein product [Symbiodinium natans]
MRRSTRCFLAISLAVSCLTHIRLGPLFVPLSCAEGRRRLLLGSVGPLLGLVGQSAQAQSSFSTEKWDGSFLDTSRDCKEVELGTPEGTCLRNIDALGGYATVLGKDSPTGDVWECLAEYDGNDIQVPFKQKGGKKATGKWFSNRKLDIKGIEWDDGTVWEKMEYKIINSPNEQMDPLGKIKNKAPKPAPGIQ